MSGERGWPDWAAPWGRLPSRVAPGIGKVPLTQLCQPGYLRLAPERRRLQLAMSPPVNPPHRSLRVLPLRPCWRPDKCCPTMRHAGC